MSKTLLPEYVEESTLETEEWVQCGPFVTISRQYGCHGFCLAVLLLDILAEQTEPPHAWRVYHKDILEHLATKTNLAAEMLERERSAKPRLIVDFFRSLSKDHIPSGYEIRRRITAIIRGVARQGHAIIVGQGGASATQDLPNGLSVCLEAPEDWRVRQVAFREGLSETEARDLVRAEERQGEYLRRFYAMRFPRKPVFNLVYDSSVFTLAQIARHVACAMRLKGCI